jgi:hypothetical protein
VQKPEKLPSYILAVTMRKGSQPLMDSELQEQHRATAEMIRGRFAKAVKRLPDGLTDARPGTLVEDLQQRPRPLAGGLRPAAQLGHAGGPCAQRDLQEAAGDGEADALGLGHGGELGLAVVVEEDRAVEAPPQVVAVGLALVELLSQAEDLLAVPIAVELIEDGGVVAVDGLSAEAVLLGESGDVAVAAAEGRRRRRRRCGRAVIR